MRHDSIHRERKSRRRAKQQHIEQTSHKEVKVEETSQHKTISVTETQAEQRKQTELIQKIEYKVQEEKVKEEKVQKHNTEVSAVDTTKTEQASVKEVSKPDHLEPSKGIEEQQHHAEAKVADSSNNNIKAQVVIDQGRKEIQSEEHKEAHKDVQKEQTQQVDISKPNNEMISSQSVKDEKADDVASKTQTSESKADDHTQTITQGILYDIVNKSKSRIIGYCEMYPSRPGCNNKVSQSYFGYMY